MEAPPRPSVDPFAERRYQPATVEKTDPEAGRILIVWGTEDRVVSDAGHLTRHCFDRDFCDLSVLATGRAPLLAEHIQDVGSVLGVIEGAWIESTPHGKQGRCIARFSRRPDARKVFDDIQDGIITGFSVGSRVTGMTPDPYLDGAFIDRIQPYEVSVCAMGRNSRARAQQGMSQDMLARLLARVRMEQEEDHASRVRSVLRADAWETWAERIAPAIATAAGGDGEVVAAQLRAAVAGHLEGLARRIIAARPAPPIVIERLTAPAAHGEP